MVGKMKRVRQKLHQEAVKPNLETQTVPLLAQHTAVKPLTTAGVTLPLFGGLKAAESKTDAQAQVSFPSAVFAGTNIHPKALVQTLKFETASQRGHEEHKQVSKKQKMKERRERWLNKISSIKLVKQQLAEQARRKATPVVGDMMPLAEALPELSELVASSRHTTCKKGKLQVKKIPAPTDFTQMKPAQKRKLMEEEMVRFSNALKNQTFGRNPLAAIGEHLRKRLRQEEEDTLG